MNCNDDASPRAPRRSLTHQPQPLRYTSMARQTAASAAASELSRKVKPLRSCSGWCVLEMSRTYGSEEERTEEIRKRGAAAANGSLGCRAGRGPNNQRARWNAGRNKMSPSK